MPTLTPQNTDRRRPTPANQAMQHRMLLATQQLRDAAAARSEQDRRAEDRSLDDREHEEVYVRIQWAQTTRYEANLCVDPWSSETEIFALLAALPDRERRVLDFVDSDNHLVSVVDLDGDGHIDTYEMSAGLVTDWGDVADSIDESIAASPSWPALNAALVAAASEGYDVATNLPHLAAEAPLPAHDSAGELYYRLLGSGVAGLASDLEPGSAGEDAAPPPRRDNPPGLGADPPAASAPAI